MEYPKAKSAALTSLHKIVRLVGKWQIVEGSMGEVPEVFDLVVSVPGLVDPPPRAPRHSARVYSARMRRRNVAEARIPGRRTARSCRDFTIAKGLIAINPQFAG